MAVLKGTFELTKREGFKVSEREFGTLEISMLV